MNKTTAFHGSDIEQIAAYYHLSTASIISFGANVNPLGLSPTVKKKLSEHLDIITRYPDRNYTSLKQAIAKYCCINPAFIAVGNGSTELISLLISQRSPARALIIGPTYSEYERELSLSGARIAHYQLSEERHFQLHLPDLLPALTFGIGLLIICNPNNPTSSAVSQKDLRTIIAACRDQNIFVMIDETYIEFAPDPSQITAVPLTADFDNVMIIRGVSKFFAAPGLRFGYGITSNQEFLNSLQTHQNPWSLNSIGAFAGELMLTDQDYIAQTRRLILTERERLYQEISHWPNVKVYNPFANFLLLQLTQTEITAQALFEHTARQGLIIRDCSSFQSLDGEYIRFCFMKPDENDRLLSALKSALQGEWLK